jgi:hypothetical protein
MPFAGVGGTSIRDGYAIDNSLRFNSGDSPYLSQTLSTPTNRKIWTYSTWVKRSTLGASKVILAHNKVGNPNSAIRFNSTDDTIRFFDVNASSTTVIDLITSQVFRDVSAFYHIVLSVDTTQATSSDRVKLYINGNQVTSFSTETYPSQNYDTTINSTEDVLEIGASNGTTNFDGYMAETYFIDGQQLSPTDFGEFDEDSGIWKPIRYSGSYGTNGFYLDFENSGSLGADQSGNGNNFTPTNLASTDQTTDTPTNNFATLNALDNYYANSTFSEGNVKISQNNDAFNTSTMKMSSGKWYWEAKLGNTSGYDSIGITQNVATSSGQVLGNLSTAYGMRSDAGQIITNNSGNSYGVSFTSGDIIGVGLDLDNNKLYFSKNGTWMNSADPSAGTGGFSISAGEYFAGFGKNDVATGSIWEVNFGNPNFSISSGNSDANGYGNMEYSFPTGYLALCTQNLATELSPTIDDGSQYFNTVLYTGNGTNPRSLTGVGFQPDFTWIKNRTDTWGHGLADSTRGGGKTLITNSTAVEQTNYTWGYVDSFDSDGFTVDDGASGDDFVNQTSDNYVSWNWKANAGSTSSNTDGATTSTVQVNQSAGFSIVTYSMGGSSSTFGHGLGKTPSFIIFKRKDVVGGWNCYHQSIGVNGIILLNGTDGAYTGFNYFPTMNSTVVGVDGSSAMVNNTIAYCFAEIEGYSKFGSYTGNGSTDGTFVYTGFRPSFVLTKRTDTNGYSWGMVDSKRSPYNQANKHLFANASDAEYTTLDKKDLLSNGFKHRTNLYGNLSGGTYIYMAFAENPFVSSTGIPVVAR